MSRKNSGRRSSILNRRSKKGERLVFWAKRIGLIGGFAVFMLWVASWLVLSGSLSRFHDHMRHEVLEITAKAGFSVENILVKGRVYTDADTLKAITNIRKGDPLFSFDPHTAQEMIEKLSWVKTAHVERRMPNTVYIEIAERKPLALWQQKKQLSLIDAEGIVLTDHQLQRFKNLIIVVGDQAPNKAADLLSFLAAEPQVLGHVTAATLIAHRRWDLKLKSGATVKLPEEELGLALRRLGVTHEREELLSKKVKVIDVRNQDRITVRTYPGAALEYKAGYQQSGGI